jgi:hypothetical protein
MTNSTSESALRGAAAVNSVGAGLSRKDDVWSRVLVLLLAVLVFYLPNHAQFRIDTGVRGLNVVNVLFFLAVWVMCLCRRPPSQPLPFKRHLWALFALLTLSLGVALVGDASAWVEDVTVYKNTLFYPLLFVFFFFAVRDTKVIYLLLMVTVFVFFTSAVLGIRQALDYGIAEFHDHKRVAAPFGWEMSDANRSAIFFCIYLQLVAAIALFATSRPALRWVCVALYAMGVFVVFFTYSRQALFILAVLGLLMLARKHLLLAALFAVLLYHYELWVPEPVIERVKMTRVDPFDAYTPRAKGLVLSTELSIGQPFVPKAPRMMGADAEGADSIESSQQFDASTESRFTLWAGAWELIKGRPWGVGLNRFKREIGPFVPISMAGKDAHNAYVLLAAEASLLAPIVLLVLIAACLAMGMRLSKLQGEAAKVMGNGLIFATLAAALGSLYGSRLFDGEVMGNFWIFLALSARLLIIKESESRARSAATDNVGYQRGAYRGSRRMANPMI